MPIAFKKPNCLKDFKFGSTLVWSTLKNYINTITGVSPLLLNGAIAHPILSLTQKGKCIASGGGLICNNGSLVIPNFADISESNVVMGKYIANDGSEKTSSSDFYCAALIPVGSGADYTMHTSAKLGYYSVMEYDENGDFLKRTLYGTSSQMVGDTITHTVGEATWFIRWGSNPTYTAITYEDVCGIDWMLTESSTAQDFIPYKKAVAVGPAEVITATSGDTASAVDLFAVGDFADTQDIVSGVVERQTEVICYDGTQTIRDPYLSGDGRALYIGSLVVKPRTTLHTGTTVTITTDHDTPLTALVEEFGPTQNLHGYTKPWRGGCGKNLVDVNDVTGVTSQTQIGAVTLPAGDYVLSAYISNAGSAGAGVRITKSDNTTIKSIGHSTSTIASRYSGSFSLAEETSCKIFVVGTASGYNADVFNVQVESGTTLTDYEPYENICPISGRTELEFEHKVQGEQSGVWIDADFSDVGTVYHGFVDFVNGKLIVDSAMIDLGTLNWIKLQATTDQIWGTAGVSGPDVDVTPICSAYDGKSKANNNRAAYDKGNGTCCFLKDGVITGTRFYVRDDAHINDTAEEFKAYMSGVKMVYRLRTPAEYEIDGGSISVNGTTIFTSEAGAGPLEVYVLAPTTETVTAQDINLVNGDNTLTITAVINGIELEAVYMAYEDIRPNSGGTEPEVETEEPEEYEAEDDW